MAQHPGPAYMRTSRPKTPVIYGNDDTFAIGGSKVLRQSDATWRRWSARASPCSRRSRPTTSCRRDGIAIRVIDLYSRPADRRRHAPRRGRAERRDGVITVEDHYAAGGIGDAAAEAVARAGVAVTRLAVREIPRTGKPEELLDRYGISRATSSRR